MPYSAHISLRTIPSLTIYDKTYKHEEEDVDDDCLEAAKVAHGNDRDIKEHEVDPEDVIMLPVLCLHGFQVLLVTCPDEALCCRGIPPEKQRSPEVLADFLSRLVEMVVRLLLFLQVSLGVLNAALHLVLELDSWVGL